MTIVLRHADPPPSVNRAWRNFRGRMVQSSEFKNWKKAAVASFQRQGLSLPSSCFWSTKIFMPGSSRIDLDNCNKAIHDAIVEAKIAPDDFYLVNSNQTYWDGEYLIIHLKEEPIDKWAATLKTSRAIIRRMEKAKIAHGSQLLV